MIWNGNYGLQGWLENLGAGFHDFAGSVVVHAMGGWIALAAVILLGARNGRYKNDGRVSAHPPSSIPFLALGFMDFDCGLVWLQCDECSTGGSYLWIGGN